MLARLRRAGLAVLCSLPTVLPVIAVASSPAVLVACGGGEKPVKRPKPTKPVPRGPTVEDVLKDARAAAAAGDVDKAHAKYKEAEGLKKDVAIYEEHTK